MKIYERPKCEKCEEMAIGLMRGIWLCGRCIEKLTIKLNEQKRKELLELIE
jgi:ribosomal protein L37AE/L43A